MKIGIIGAGRAGTAFALALSARGAQITGVSSRSAEAVGFISKKLGIIFTNDPAQTVREAELVILAVPDACILDAAEKIHETCDCEDISGKTFLHCSGAMTSAELETLSKSGGYTGSLHPIQTFATREDGWRSMDGIYFGYEGSTEARAKALELVKLLEGTLMDIKTEAKPLYHAAACILSNYTVTLSHVAGKLLEAAGIGKGKGIEAFMPLLRNTAANIAAEGSLKALTGPIARGDVATVNGHLNAMEGMDKNIIELYRAIGRETVKLAVEKGSIDISVAGHLLEILM